MCFDFFFWLTGCKYIQLDEPLFARMPDTALAYGMDHVALCKQNVDPSVASVDIHLCRGYSGCLVVREFERIPLCTLQEMKTTHLRVLTCPARRAFATMATEPSKRVPEGSKIMFGELNKVTQGVHVENLM